MKIGIDIGGTNLAAGVVNDKGEIVICDSCPAEVEQGYSAVLDKLVMLVNTLRDECRREYLNDPITSIGCGVPGIVKDGVVINAPNLFWKNKPLAKDLSERTDLPVYLVNDATAAGIAENRFGASKGCKDALMYTLGTGVGGAVIVNGAVVNGAHGVASEFGHTLVGPGFYTCNCGKRGCLETYSSATALVKGLVHAVEEGVQTALNLETATAKDVVDAAREGDPAALKAFDTMVDKLGLSMANMIDILDPEIIVVGGGVSGAGDFLFDALRKKTAEYTTYKEFEPTPIVQAEFGNDAGIIGAAYAGEYL